MKKRLDNIEKKIVASDRNQPRIYLSKQEAQNFDLARSVFVSIEQEDYSVVDSEVIDFFNIKLSDWFADQKDVQYSTLAKFIGEMMAEHNFTEVFRGEESIAYSRNDKFLNLSYPINQEDISFPKFSFNDQISWLWKKIFKSEKTAGIGEWKFFIDFPEIIADLYSGGLISAAIVTKINGDILYSPKNWTVKPEELKEIIYDWKHRNRSIRFNDEKYAMLNNSPDYFSAVNSKDKTYIIGALSPEINGERLLIFAHTPANVDAKQSYVEVVRAANRMKDEGTYIPPSYPGLSGKVAPLLKEEYEAIAALEKELGKPIPIISKMDFKSFGFSAHNKRIVALAINQKSLKSLPESFLNLKSLQTLYLCGNQLDSLPEAFGSLAALKELYISSNKLKTLPDSIGQLQSLQILDARYNALKSLPESLGLLSSLKMLNLMNNQLSALPESIGNLSKLQVLNVCDNWLKKFPESIVRLSGLKEFWMSANEISLSESIKGFFQDLEAQGCHFDNFEDEKVQLKRIPPSDFGYGDDSMYIADTLSRVIKGRGAKKTTGVILDLGPKVVSIIPYFDNNLIAENVIQLVLHGQETSNTIKYRVLNEKVVNETETECTIADAVRNAVRSCDIKIRRDLYDSVMLTGTNSVVKQSKFKAELADEIKKLIPTSVTLRIIRVD